MCNSIKLEKEIKRKEYNLIRDSNPSSLQEKIKASINNALIELLSENKKKHNYLGIYWPLKGEFDIRFLKERKNQKLALPASSNDGSIKYHHWSRENLILDSNNIPSPLKEKILSHDDLSLLLVPALAIDQKGYRLGYGGGYFDRLRQKKEWRSIPSFVIISQNCVSEKPLPRNSWDIPFDGWINENGLHQVQQTK